MLDFYKDWKGSKMKSDSFIKSSSVLACTAFDVERKTKSGKEAARGERKLSRVPAVIYGGADTAMVSLPEKEFLLEYYKGGLQSKVISLNFCKSSDDVCEENLTKRVVVRDIQLHPVTDKPLHIDFQEIRAGAKVKIQIPVKIVNAKLCHGLKIGGVLNCVRRSVAFYCDPNCVPDCIEIDVSELEIGASVHINDLKLSSSLIPVDKKTNFALVSIMGRTATAEASKTAVAEGSVTTAEAASSSGATVAKS